MNARAILFSIHVQLRSTRLISVVGTLGLVALAGCNEEPQTVSPGVERRDSSGVTVVTNSQADRSLRATEQLRLGAVEGPPDELFYGIRTLDADERGRFWVVDASPSIRHYGSDGNLVEKVGGAGEGPGEADGYSLAIASDTHVMALGLNDPILQVFRSDGTFVESRSAIIPDGGTLLPLGFGAGRWVFWTRSFPTHFPPLFRQGVVLLRAAGLEEPLDTVLSFAGPLRRTQAPGRTSKGSYFAGEPAFDMDSNGHIFVSDTSDYVIRRYAADGSLTQVLTRSVEPRRFDARILDEVEEGVRSGMAELWGTVDEDYVDRIMHAISLPSYPEHLPVVEDILVGSDGSMLVERADRHPDLAMKVVADAFGYIRHAWLPEWIAPRAFDLFAPGGEYQGTIEFPGTVAPMDIVGSRVYGVEYNELDVEFIVVYSLQDDETTGSR